MGIFTQTSILRVFDPIEMHGVIETLQRTLQQLGLNIEQVLATAVDHDTHLPAAFCSIQKDDPSDLKVGLAELQTQVTYLVKHPELSSGIRQTALSTVLEVLQQLQGLL